MTAYTPVPDSQNGLIHTNNSGTPQNRNLSISSNAAVERSESPHSIVNIDSGYSASDFHGEYLKFKKCTSILPLGSPGP